MVRYAQLVRTTARRMCYAITKSGTLRIQGEILGEYQLNVCLAHFWHATRDPSRWHSFCGYQCYMLWREQGSCQDYVLLPRVNTASLQRQGSIHGVFLICRKAHSVINYANNGL